MKKNILFALVILIFVGLYFFIYKNNDADETSADLNYKEPAPGFFDSSQVDLHDIVITITDSGFVPDILTIKKGDKVTWVNKTSGYSWPASNPHPTHTNNPAFDPELPMKTNQAWSFVFDKTGNWSYHDHLSPTKRGVINVL